MVQFVTPGDVLRDTLDDHTGPTRLDDLRDNYNGEAFETAVIQLVKTGEIALLPVGEVVHVKQR